MTDEKLFAILNSKLDDLDPEVREAVSKLMIKYLNKKLELDSLKDKIWHLNNRVNLITETLEENGLIV